MKAFNRKKKPKHRTAVKYSRKVINDFDLITDRKKALRNSLDVFTVCNIWNSKEMENTRYIEKIKLGFITGWEVIKTQEEK